MFFKPKAETLEQSIDRTIAPEARETLVQYISRAKELDGILSELTKDYCRNECKRKPVGCCRDESTYIVSGIKELSKLQESEARENGWRKPEKGKCRYHGPTGCYLKSSKPPICIGFLCYQLKDDALKDYNPTTVRQFTSAMLHVCEGFLSGKEDAQYLFTSMDLAIEAGKKLVEQRRQNQYLQIEGAEWQ